MIRGTKSLLAVICTACLGWACDKAAIASSVPEYSPPPECGNNVRVGDEACDGADLAGQSCTSVGYDSGTLSCAADCTFDVSGCVGVGPVCPNDVAEGLEECDGVDRRAATCSTLGFADGILACTASCTFDPSGCTGAAPVCGDANAEGLEECDGVDLKELDCVALGFDGGVLSCDSTCRLVTGECVGASTFCGDGTAQATEQCDGADLNGLACVDLGYDSGVLGCDASCLFDVSACVGTPAVCGDGILDGLEQCDGTVLGSTTCVDLGYAGGTLACDDSCTFDPSACTRPVCPNDVKEPGEDCDGTDLGGATCGDLGLGTGTVTCNADCTYNATGCTTPTCGDSTVNQTSELCDGDDLDGETCRTLSFQGGMLACNSDCTFNTLACFGSTATCGDDILDLSEACDGALLGDATCLTEGYDGGTLSCTVDCTLDTTNCTGSGPVCPDGVAEGAEECDGADLKNLTCLDFGFTGGTLTCSAQCTLSLSGCTMNPVCGNDTADRSEECDGTDLRDQTCASLDMGTGTLACSDDCLSFDYTGCTLAPECGNNAVEATEVCDGTDLPGGTTCDVFGYYGTEAVACIATCGGYDLSACTSPRTNCGNSRAQGMEQCDKTDLRGASCTSLGYSSGALACHTNCSYDVSACVP
jgi:hypothetical protein